MAFPAPLLLEHRALLWCEGKPQGQEGQRRWRSIVRALHANGASSEARIIVAFKVIGDEDDLPQGLGYDGDYNVTACDGTTLVPCEVAYLYVLGILAEMGRSPVVTLGNGVYYFAADSLGQLVQSRPLLRYLEALGSTHGISQTTEEQIEAVALLLKAMADAAPDGSQDAGSQADVPDLPPQDMPLSRPPDLASADMGKGMPPVMRQPVGIDCTGRFYSSVQLLGSTAPATGRQVLDLEQVLRSDRRGWALEHLRHQNLLTAHICECPELQALMPMVRQWVVCFMGACGWARSAQGVTAALQWATVAVHHHAVCASRGGFTVLKGHTELSQAQRLVEKLTGWSQTPEMARVWLEVDAAVPSGNVSPFLGGRWLGLTSGLLAMLPPLFKDLWDATSAFPKRAERLELCGPSPGTSHTLAPGLRPSDWRRCLRDLPSSEAAREALFGQESQGAVAEALYALAFAADLDHRYQLPGTADFYAPAAQPKAEAKAAPPGRGVQPAAGAAAAPAAAPIDAAAIAEAMAVLFAAEAKGKCKLYMPTAAEQQQVAQPLAGDLRLVADAQAAAGADVGAQPPGAWPQPPAQVVAVDARVAARRQEFRQAAAAGAQRPAAAAGAGARHALGAAAAAAEAPGRLAGQKRVGDTEAQQRAAARAAKEAAQAANAAIWCDEYVQDGAAITDLMLALHATQPMDPDMLKNACALTLDGLKAFNQRPNRLLALPTKECVALMPADWREVYMVPGSMAGVGGEGAALHAMALVEREAASGQVERQVLQVVAKLTSFHDEFCGSREALLEHLGAIKKLLERQRFDARARHWHIAPLVLLDKHGRYLLRLMPRSGCMPWADYMAMHARGFVPRVIMAGALCQGVVEDEICLEEVGLQYTDSKLLDRGVVITQGAAAHLAGFAEMKVTAERFDNGGLTLANRQPVTMALTPLLSPGEMGRADRIAPLLTAKTTSGLLGLFFLQHLDLDNVHFKPTPGYSDGVVKPGDVAVPCVHDGHAKRIFGATPDSLQLLIDLRKAVDELPKGDGAMRKHVLSISYRLVILIHCCGGPPPGRATLQELLVLVSSGAGAPPNELDAVASAPGGGGGASGVPQGADAASQDAWKAAGKGERVGVQEGAAATAGAAAGGQAGSAGAGRASAGVAGGGDGGGDGGGASSMEEASVVAEAGVHVDGADAGTGTASLHEAEQVGLSGPTGHSTMSAAEAQGGAVPAEGGLTAGEAASAAAAGAAGAPAAAASLGGSAPEASVALAHTVLGLSLQS